MHDTNTNVPCCILKSLYDWFNWNFMDSLTHTHTGRQVDVHVCTWIAPIHLVMDSSSSTSKEIISLAASSLDHLMARFLTLTLKLTSFINQLTLYCLLKTCLLVSSHSLPLFLSVFVSSHPVYPAIWRVTYVFAINIGWLGEEPPDDYDNDCETCCATFLTFINVRMCVCLCVHSRIKCRLIA